MSRAKSSRRLLGFSIFFFWLLMTGLLLRREWGVRTLPNSPVGSLVTETTESKMGIFLASGQRVGQVHLRNGPENRQGKTGVSVAGVSMQIDADMRLNLLGKSTDLDIEGSVWRPQEPSWVEFEFGIRSAEHDFHIAGEVAEGALQAEVISAGETIPLNLPVDGQVIFSNGFGAALQFPTLEVGEEVRLASFDPLTMSQGKARVRCIAKETLQLASGPVETRRLLVTTSGLRSSAWIDSQGEVVRAETPFGLVLERLPLQEDPVLAQQSPNTSGDDMEDLLGMTAIVPTGMRPVRGVQQLTIQLSGVDLAKLPQDRVQKALGSDRYRLAVPQNPAEFDSKNVEPVDKDSDEYLASDTFVQSDHPKIRRQAEKIIQHEKDPWKKALAIHDWVFTKLDKEAVISIPSALEVLAQKRGDCNEHTVLFAALARAAGVPTRIAIGLVWSDELAGFYYHAWPEVHVGDGWTWMDPTLGQPLADATHVKLLNGGIERWPQLLPYIGNLQIEVLEMEGKS